MPEEQLFQGEYPLIRVVPDAVDVMGRLDRLLSEFLLLSESQNLDEADAQTVKHHADDLIGVGQKALDTLKKRGL